MINFQKVELKTCLEHALSRCTLADVFRAPTVPAGEVSMVKRNYKQHFDQMVFTTRTVLLHQWKNGRLVKPKNMGEVQYERRSCEKTTPIVDKKREN